jgi:hypothetical protein
MSHSNMVTDSKLINKQNLNQNNHFNKNSYEEKGILDDFMRL